MRHELADRSSCERSAQAGDAHRAIAGLVLADRHEAVGRRSHAAYHAHVAEVRGATPSGGAAQVLAVGRPGDALGAVCAALVTQGYEVSLLEVVGEYDQASPAIDGLSRIEGVDGWDLVKDSDLLAEVLDEHGPFDAVVIGFWSELVGIDACAMDALCGRGVEVVAFEGPAWWSEQATRWLLAWAADRGVTASVFRRPNAPSTSRRAQRPLPPVAAAVHRTGLAEPVTLREANRAAARRRRAGEDVLAGRLWTEVDAYDSANSWLIAADADDVERVRGAVSARDLTWDREAEVLVPLGVHFAVTYPSNGIASVQVTPASGPPDAIRVSNVFGEFDEPESFEPLGSFRVPSGAVIVGNPWDVFDGGGGVRIEVGDGVGFDVETFGESGFRMRRRGMGRLVETVTVTVRRGRRRLWSVRCTPDGRLRWEGGLGCEPAGVAHAVVSLADVRRLVGHVARVGCIEWVEPQPAGRGAREVQLDVERAGHRHRVVSRTGLLDGIALRAQRLAALAGWQADG